MKTTEFRVRLSDENSAMVKQMAESAGLQYKDIATMLLHAACAAVRTDYRAVNFPVKFRIEVPQGSRAFELNEPKIHDHPPRK